MPFKDQSTVILSYIINESYKRFFDKSLVEDLSNPEFLSESLYKSPMVILAHSNTEDPIFIYANQTAQDLWGYSWQEFMNLPSRLSAEQDMRAERQQFLDEVASKGFSSNYSGIRVDKSGRRFSIKNTKLWNLYGEDNRKLGQAACFDSWEYL